MDSLVRGILYFMTRAFCQWLTVGAHLLEHQKVSILCRMASVAACEGNRFTFLLILTSTRKREITWVARKCKMLSSYRHSNLKLTDKQTDTLIEEAVEWSFKS